MKEIVDPKVYLKTCAGLLGLLALTWLSARYDRLTGRPSGEHRTSPWLRSMRGEEENLARARLGTTPVEWIVTVSTVVAVISLEVWFFVFAGSPLPGL